jgi:hypothetical protein
MRDSGTKSKSGIKRLRADAPEGDELRIGESGDESTGKTGSRLSLEQYPVNPLEGLRNTSSNSLSKPAPGRAIEIGRKGANPVPPLSPAQDIAKQCFCLPFRSTRSGPEEAVLQNGVLGLRANFLIDNRPSGNVFSFGLQENICLGLPTPPAPNPPHRHRSVPCGHLFRFRWAPITPGGQLLHLRDAMLDSRTAAQRLCT